MQQCLRASLLLHYKENGPDKSDCPKGVRQYTQYCHEKPDESFKPGKHSGNCKNIKAALNKLKCFSRRLGPKKAPTATKEDCPKEMANYKKWCHENADGSFKAGKNSGNCKNIKQVLTELDCVSTRLALSKGSEPETLEHCKSDCER